MSQTPVSVAPDIFTGGESFLYACGVLNARAKQDPHIVQAVMAVNSAFALELFLKCLQTLDSGDYSRRHDLDQLYYELPKPTQEEIRRRLDEVQASTKYGPFYAGLRSDGYKTDLDSLLEMGRKAFEHFRYAFDPEIVAQKARWALDDFMFIVRDLILERHPEWTPKGYPSPRSKDWWRASSGGSSVS